MAFSHRMATLAAVVAIPLGIAVTSYALTDSPDPPRPPAKVELDGESPSPARTGPSPGRTAPADGSAPASPSGSPGGNPSKGVTAPPSGQETVPRPPATDERGGDDRGEDDDDDGNGSRDRDRDGDDGPGGEG
ncbi:hypothetical protein [Streptomyces sp. PU-14G]|uniref:hypothetical protein n=1 Tax=Streptomyces sp. PU-14G TaxID=2800808 RepID=UPI0034DF3340